MKHRSNRVNSQRTGPQVPEGDSDYEYAVSERMPPDRPPIDRSEFKDYANFCARPCYWRLWVFHDCNEPSEHYRLVSRLPKKKTWWHLDSPEPSVAWGLECVHEISASRVLAWHAAFVSWTFGIWIWWLIVHPGDIQNAAVPLTVMITLMSTFWGCAGIIRIPFVT